MGLESVELIIEWENRTGATLSDGEAASIRTPEAAFQILRKKLSSEPPGTCASQLAFAEIRRWLMSQGHERSAITPKTLLTSLSRRPQRLVKTLYRDQGIDRGIGCQPLPWGLLGSAALILGLQLNPFGSVLITTGFVFIGMAIFGFFYRRRFTTVGELALHLSIHHRGRYQSSFSDDEIRSMIRDTTIGTLGIKEDQFGWDRRFIEDLGMD